MLDFIRFLQGYVTISIQGYSPERFMNLCRNNGIILWDIVSGEQIYYCKVTASDFKRMKPFIQKTEVRASIIKKYGLPFFVHKNKKRKIFFAGIPICILFLYFMTGFIWAFDFQGNLQVSDDALYEFCEAENVRIGSRIKEIDIEGLEQRLREKYDCITWVSVTIKGTRLVIDLNENDRDEIVTEENNKSMDIIAIEDGTIISIVTRAGIPKVKKDVSVKKGDILVEGSVPVFDNDGNIISYEYCEADADIMLQCKYPVLKKISRYYCYKNYTGRTIDKGYLRIGEKMFSFNIKNVKFPCYDTVKEERQLKVYQDIYFPVYLGKIKYRDYVEIDALYSDEAAVKLLEEYLSNKIKELNEKGVQIIQNNVKIEKTRENVSLNGNLLITLWNDRKKAALPKTIEKKEQELLNE